MGSHDFDVVIAGAGISGLVLGSELSKHVSVLILEKQREDHVPQKYWLTPSACLAENPGLIDCVNARYTQMRFISYDSKEFQLVGDYLLWDSDKLINDLKNSILSNGGQIKYSHRFYTYSISNSGISVRANNEAFKARLLVDCLGYSSPLAQLDDAVRILGHYILYGGVLKLRREIVPVVLANVILDRHPHYLEIFPRADSLAYLSLIKPVTQVKSVASLKSDFNFITKNSHYSEYFEHSEDYKEIWGIIPVGSIKKTAFDRVLLFGEAGQMQPAATSTCLTKLLTYQKVYSEFILESLRLDKLRGKDLEHHPRTMGYFSRRFQLNIYREMQDWSSIDFAKLIDLLNCLDSKTLNEFIFDEVDRSDFMNPRRLYKMLKSGNLVWVKPFIKACF